MEKEYPLIREFVKSLPIEWIKKCFLKEESFCPECKERILKTKWSGVECDCGYWFCY